MTTSTSTPTKPNHALDNCKGQLETIVELYMLRDLDDDDRDIMQEAQDMALGDVCWKSDDWQSVMCKEGFSPTKGRVLLSWGGPACQVICDLSNGDPSDPEIQYQDWGTPWTSHHDLIELERTALEWFVNQFWWGE